MGPIAAADMNAKAAAKLIQPSRMTPTSICFTLVAHQRGDRPPSHPAECAKTITSAGKAQADNDHCARFLPGRSVA
jgi:hypothetical protein